MGRCNLFAGRALPGQARAALEASLSFRVGGRMQERRVKTGDTVQEGDIVATLDGAPYQAEVDSISASLQRARTAYANPASQLDRDKQLAVLWQPWAGAWASSSGPASS
jgi:multidrug efflux system membrane fusion protein